jgi:3-isopropylmalate/(R)-2-methylmalate dehydratase small subunit
MKTFRSLTSHYVPIPIKDVDTDMLIPAQFLTSISKEGYGQNLFRRLRDGDPNFPLNWPAARGAKILVGDQNFGCGSSREHAAWALLGAGFEVIIAKSFADIFSGNAANNGLLLITLPDESAQELLVEGMRMRGGPPISIDLQHQTVTALGKEYPFSYDPFRKHCLLNGLDTLDYLLSFQDEIRAHFQQSDEFRFASTAALQKDDT